MKTVDGHFGCPVRTDHEDGDDGNKPVTHSLVAYGNR